MRNIFAFIVLAVGLFAQGERSELNGIVTDSTGAAIPGVTVTALEVQTKVETRAVSSVPIPVSFAFPIFSRACIG